jgi:nicotinamidase-related amidase
MSTALLVIDLQRGMFTAGPEPHEGETVLSRVAGLIEQARDQGVPVLHVRHDGGAGDPLERETPGWEIHSAVAPRAGEPIIDKTRCSAFYETGLQEELQRRGIQRLIVAGMQTEYCIDTSCRAARDLGYQVVLIQDGHTTFDSSVLPAERIIAHHNRTLNSGGFVELTEAAAVKFLDRNR